MARRAPRKRRTSQIIFLILSIIVVLSMVIGYLLTTLPLPSPPTPTPIPSPTYTPEALLTPLLPLLA